METFITTTFIIILSFSVMNLIVSIIIYFSSKQMIYLRTGFFWLFLIFNFLIQAKSQNNEKQIILGYGFSIIPLNILAYASMYFCGRSYPVRKMLWVMLASVILTLALLNSDHSFTVKAMPFATAGAMPLLYTVFAFLKSRRSMTTLMAVQSVVLTLLAIHSFNFAFFRMQPSAQLWGWPVAYGLYQLLAVLLPALTLDFNHRSEQKRLIRLVQEKTQDLLTANQKLQLTIEEKNFLFRTLTHDISNPLMILQMKISRYKEMTKDVDAYFANLQAMTKRITSLIEQVRRFDSVERNIHKLKLSQVSLLGCLTEAENLFVESLREKNLKLRYSEEELKSYLVHVERDSFVNSVLPNLISNAIKFSHPNNEIQISVAAVNDRFLTLSVEDSGIGIPPDMIDNLFAFSSNSSRRGTLGEKGSGCGMPIMAKLIQAYGGSIQVVSEVETAEKRGHTQFQVELPLCSLPSYLAPVKTG